MPEENDPTNMLQGLLNYMDMVATSRFLKKYEKIWEEQLLLYTSGEDKEVGYIGLEVVKAIYKNIDMSLEKAHTEADFNDIMKKNFNDPTQE